MLTLTNKRATIGVINNRVEKHGDEDVTAFDIPVDLLLDPKELDALVGNHTHRSLFDKKGDVYEPNFPRFDGFSLKDDFEGATVTLVLGMTDHASIEFEDCRLKSIELSPQVGGETAMSFKLQVRPEPRDYVKLIESQNSELKISLGDARVAEKAKSKQQDLALGRRGVVHARRLTDDTRETHASAPNEGLQTAGSRFRAHKSRRLRNNRIRSSAR